MSQDETEAIEWANLMKRLDNMEEAIRDIDIEINMIRNTLSDDTPQEEVKSTCSVIS